MILHLIGDRSYALCRRRKVDAGDRFAVDLDPLREILDVGRSIKACSVSCLSEHGCKHGARTAFSVAACDMNEPQLLLRFTEAAQQLFCAFEAKSGRAPGAGFNIVDRFFYGHLDPVSFQRFETVRKDRDQGKLDGGHDPALDKPGEQRRDIRQTIEHAEPVGVDQKAADDLLQEHGAQDAREGLFFMQEQSVDQACERGGHGEAGEKRSDREQERAQNVGQNAHHDCGNGPVQDGGGGNRNKIETQLDAFRRTDRTEARNDDFHCEQNAQNRHGFRCNAFILHEKTSSRDMRREKEILILCGSGCGTGNAQSGCFVRRQLPILRHLTRRSYSVGFVCCSFL